MKETHRMTFGQGLAFAHRESWAFLLACPVLAAIPVLAEFAQHIAEMQVGMYSGPEAAEATAEHPLRMAFGLIKVIALTASIFWITRFLHGRRDTAAARSSEPRALKLFAIVFGLQMLLAMLGLFVFTADTPVGIGFLVFGFLFGPLAARFTVGAPLGIWISPLRSIRDLLPHFLFAVGFGIIAMLPLMVAHYALGIGAIFVESEALKWVMLVADSLLVGWLAALLTAIVYVIALRSGPLEESDSTAANA